MGSDELKEDMDQIKILCIVTHILEMTRRLPNDEKQKLESFCDKRMLKKMDKQQAFKTLQEYKKNNIDLISIRKVSNLQFKQDKKSGDFLEGLYLKSQKEQDGFKDYFDNMIKSAISKERQYDNSKINTVQEEKNKVTTGQNAGQGVSVGSIQQSN